jgi:hypothetical protein
MLYLGNKNLPLNMNTVERVANRLKREVTLRGPFRLLTERRHEAELAANAPNLPKLAEADAALVRDLKQKGVLQRPIAALGIAGTDAVLAGLEQLASELKGMATKGNNAPRLPISRLLEIPEIYLWGLDERLLDIVESYIGLPVHYHGADVRREIADGATTDVRQWHIDAEDHRMFKIIAYLDHDVTNVGGPFEYMTRETSLRAARRLHYVSGFVTDARMKKAVPVTEWRMATGPKHTANIADTCAVFHRAKPPTQVDRYSVTFSWTSRKAMKTYASMPMAQETYDALLSRLSPRQRGCVPPRTPPA